MVHTDDIQLFNELLLCAFELSRKHRLGLTTFEHKRRPDPSTGTLGICYPDEKRIGVVVRWKSGKSWWSKRLDTPEILETVAHELAHLRFLGHGEDHKAFTRQLIDEINVMRNW